MKSTSKDAPVVSHAEILATAMDKQLHVLLEAHDCSKGLRQETWEFAVELANLLEAGCTRTALRWLVAQGYVEHAIETTRASAKKRSFRRVANLSMAAKTCFVLTAKGVTLARHPHHRTKGVVLAAKTVASTLPRWDAGVRELRVGSVLVKQFRRPAPCQELILAAFEEEGWPRHLDDPLPPQAGLVAKRRLLEAIDRLNRRQKRRLLRFHGDGTGRGVCWELLEIDDR